VPVPCFLLFLCFRKATQEIFSELDETKVEPPIFTEASWRPKMRWRGARGQAHHRVAQPSPWLRNHMVRPGGPPSDTTLSPISSPRREKPKRRISFSRNMLLATALPERGISVGGLLHHHGRLRSDVWYVQNVSTFPNTFAIVYSLICVFWIQLTRTNAIFSRIALVSCFCAEIQLSGKIPENTAKFLFYQKTHGARRRDGEGLGARLTTKGRGPGLAMPGGGEANLAASSSPPFAYIYPSIWNYRGFGVFPR
jgi:hypothetical protein